MNRLSDATLNGMTKKQLIEYVRMCEHNYDIAEETLRQQAENVKDWRHVKRGHWILHFDDLFPEESTIECSVCHEHSPADIPHDNFCQNCGAKMDGDKDG
jgi:hypothetical protein